jgi:hypothetical protein
MEMTRVGHKNYKRVPQLLCHALARGQAMRVLAVHQQNRLTHIANDFGRKAGDLRDLIGSCGSSNKLKPPMCGPAVSVRQQRTRGRRAAFREKRHPHIRLP